MKILFVNPSRGGQGYVPLNLPLLIAILKIDGHDVRLFDVSDYEIFDQNSYGRRTDKLFFKEADFDSDQLAEDRKAFYRKYKLKEVSGFSLKQSDYSEDFRDLLEDFVPDIVAVSCLSLDYRFICEFLTPFKRQYGFPVIFGGIHAVLRPAETIHSDLCDFVCVGEGERSLPAFLRALERHQAVEKVAGIWIKANGKIVKNPPVPLTELSDLPLPDYDCFDPIHFYRPFDGRRYKMVNYELSRGCPFNCSYCVNGVLKEKYRHLGKFSRVKDFRQSIDELKQLIEKYRFNFIRYWDDDFTSLPGDLLRKYASVYSRKVDIPFIVNARVDTISEEKVRVLKDMGCQSVSMGIECGNSFIREKIMKRRISNQLIVDRFKLVKSYGMRVSAYNLIGLPYETREAIFETIDLNRQAEPDGFSVNFIHPYKGIPIRKFFEEQGLDPDYEVNHNGEPHFIPKGMTYEELKGIGRAFPFYVKFPRTKFREIKLSEQDDAVYERLLEQFTQLKSGES